MIPLSSLRTGRRLGVLLALTVFGMVCTAGAAEARWWKGNLHTHSLWSDGDDFPESIADWYKEHGYHFLALSDHNRMLEGEQWVTESQKNHFPEALEKNRRRFGADWLMRRDHHGTNQYRLKTLAEFRGLLEEPGRFLMIPSEEITSGHLSFPVHINATNLRKKISAKGGTNVLDVMQRGVDAVLEQRRQTGQPMFPHINHPNFGWGITAEDLMQVKGSASSRSTMVIRPRTTKGTRFTSAWSGCGTSCWPGASANSTCRRCTDSRSTTRITTTATGSARATTGAVG